MKDNYQKIESTFGQITIFKKSEDKNINKESKPRRSLKSKIVEVETKPEAKSNLNYFDEQLVGNYFEQKENEKVVFDESSSINKTSQVKTDELDYIDEIYFKPQKAPNLTSETKNITKNDLAVEDPSLNYIDQMTLKNITKLQDDDMIGSIQGIDLKESEKTKLNESTIPMIPVENLNERNERATKKNFNSNNLKKNKNMINLKQSDHKKLNDEVPKWDFITKDEAVKILKSHVCYLNEERMYCFFLNQINYIIISIFTKSFKHCY
jgi:hypothetical protein